MRLLRSDRDAPKGWMDGPWISGLPIALGSATTALDEPHEHATVTEIFLVGSGEETARVDDRSVDLASGDVLVVEPGEARTILSASSDLMMFVVHVPGEDGALGDDKTPVTRQRLGL
jgi:mannose-6-phosphate isomerase-like protein (cupin superfamily)